MAVGAAPKRADLRNAQIGSAALGKAKLAVTNLRRDFAGADLSGTMLEGNDPGAGRALRLARGAGPAGRGFPER